MPGPLGSIDIQELISKAKFVVSIKVFNILNKLLLKQIDGDFINKAILLSFRHLN